MTVENKKSLMEEWNQAKAKAPRTRKGTQTSIPVQHKIQTSMEVFRPGGIVDTLVLP